MSQRGLLNTCELLLDVIRAVSKMETLDAFQRGKLETWRDLIQEERQKLLKHEKSKPVKHEDLFI